MRKYVIALVTCTCIAGCGDPSQQAHSTSIPMPQHPEVVDPNVWELLQRTAVDVHTDSSDPKLWALHGTALYANGMYELSVQAFSEALRITPEMPKAKYIKATALWRLNRQAEAISVLISALEQIPQFDPGWRLLAQWHLDRGESHRAELAARRSYELNPKRVGTRFILAQALMDEDRTEEALQLIEQSINVGNAPPWMYMLASNCYRQLGMHVKMESSRALAGPPPDGWPDPMFKNIPKFIAGKSELTEYSLWLFEAKSPEEAMPFLLRAFTINPEHTDLRAALSIAFQESGNLQQSLLVLEGILGDPNTNYWKQYANACIEMGNRNNGGQWLIDADLYIGLALELDPDDGTAHDLAAEIDMQLDQMEKALAHWERAGQLHLESGRWKLAELSFAFSIENGSTRASVLRGLALAQIKNDHFAQAKVTINSLLESDQTNAQALELQELLPLELRQ